MPTDEKVEKELQKYESKAGGYAKDPAKARNLLKEAMNKANRSKGALAETWDKLQLFFDMIRMWIKGEYRLPTRSLITILAVIIYFVSPIDIIPDFIIGLGLVDDAAVIAYAFKQISADLEKFKAWKAAQTHVFVDPNKPGSIKQ
ncbi:methyltransferase type 11 [Bacillus sp. V3-13]|uniref:YkvA family protein n=1 Tax=Bacillus sp. V3-13 TaxID=2053728 RepID=UPI000C770131|nr:DUF1232 domain-containing protein [Bacillus sp. V3-13]PLR76089.1 methyltransferase type 11 [Bacillus sp. V3-13]